MPSPLNIKSELLRPLGALSVIQSGPVAYYRELRKSSDPILVAAAWANMLEGKIVSLADWPQVLELCRYGVVRRQAFLYFQHFMEPRLARQAATTDSVGPPTDELRRRLMLAVLDNDPATGAEVNAALYLETGDLMHLQAASEQAELAGGWRPALAWAVRMLAVAPRNATSLRRLYIVLESSGQADLLQEVGQVLIARNLYPQIAQVFLANAALGRGDADRCLTLLRAFDDAKVAADPALSSYLGPIRALRAAAEEKLRHFQRAYDAYRALMQAERARDVNPEDFIRGIVVRGKLPVPTLPSQPRPPVTQMLGFPRSGTTLLENVLAAHPDIETFEEIPALTAAIDRIERVLVGNAPPEPPEVTYAAARDRYYEQLDAYRRKPDATTLIDKMPIRTADTEFVVKLFPEWRYIFSIRHPYDVVLSCFKQRFTPNPAMENFRTLEGAIRLYDIAMTEWFKHHTMDDPAVHYVRYDELVTNFEPVMRRALDFLGVSWDDAVLDFSSAAEQRAAKTPSYQKVRQGLGIGVQTQWRNYRFAFQGEPEKTLRKWAELFGYDVD